MSHAHPPIKQSKNTCHAPKPPSSKVGPTHPSDADLGCYYIRSTFLIYTPYVWSKLEIDEATKKKKVEKKAVGNETLLIALYA